MSDATTSERRMPADTTAEQATLGAILLDREAILAVASWLTPDHFYLEKHRRTYEAALACYQQRIPPDLQTVAQELTRRDHLETLGGVPFLLSLIDATPTAYHIEFYAATVRDTAILRAIIQAGGKIAKLGFDQDLDPAAALSQAHATLTAISPAQPGSEAITLSAAIDAVLTRLDTRADTVVAPRVLSGFSDYDRITGGLHPTELLILGARPGQGKTAWALNLGYTVAHAGHRVLFVSLEMAHRELAERLLSTLTGITSDRLRDRKISDKDMALIVDAAAQLAALPLHIDDTPGQTAAGICARVHRWAAIHGAPTLVIVDHLQFIELPKEYRSNPTKGAGESSKLLKNLSRELGCTVLALSQLNRAVESRASRVPGLSDLRETGDHEQNADQVMFLYREEYYDKDTEKKGVAELHIAKHRNGATGVVNLFFDGATYRFRDLSPYRSPEGY